MKKNKKPIYSAPLIEVSERICMLMLAESEAIESSGSLDWAEGNTDWWNS
ncbi:MAG: hypothetical protein IKZ91_00880 [Bacteroidales bacterium]|nr:hypothetical protein [Bacteroidales bacterium]